MRKKFLEFLYERKTWLFLIMCLSVHAFNAVLFYFVGIIPLSVLNILSTVFYTVILVSYKEEKDFYIELTYFEILIFSLISEFCTGGKFFYIFYVIGMISVVFYLLPPKKSLKHVFQIFGIIFGIAIFFVRINEICIFPKYLSIAEGCKQEVGFLNLCITLFTVFYVSNLYGLEINAANDQLTYCSDHDLMTGLFNRRFFEHIMQRNKTENEDRKSVV